MCSEYGCCDGRCQDVAELPEESVRTSRMTIIPNQNMRKQTRQRRLLLRKLSLCSGIGGDDLASEWAGIETVAFCERDKFCQQVLRKHWPGIPIIEDVKDVTQEKIATYAVDRGCENGWGQSDVEDVHPLYENIRPEVKEFCSSGSGIDIISGGFPCQPHSVAGRHKGSSDGRNLWPEFRRILGEIKPRWFVGENVPGLFSSDNGEFFGGIMSDLAALGYAVGWCCFGANDVGAWHKRDRIFILAHAPESGLERAVPEGGTPADGLRAECGAIQHPPIPGLPDWAGGTVGQPRPLTEFERPGGREIELSFRGVAYGVSRRVDRLRALGNAVVPQQIYPIYRAIVEYESRPAGGGTEGRHAA